MMTTSSTFLLPRRISWVGGRPTGRPLFGLKVMWEATVGGEDFPLTGGRRGGIFFGGGIRGEELLEGEIVECFRGRRELVDGDIVDARLLISALVWDKRRSSVGTLSVPCKENMVKV